MTKTSDDKRISDTDQAALRARTRAVMETDGLSQREVAREAGLAYGTLTTWMTGKYAGDTHRVAQAVAIWLDSREARDATRSRLAAAPEWVETPSAARMLAILQYAQTAPDLTVIAGGAGIGKTTAARRYQATHPNVHLVTLEPCCGSVYPMLGAVAETLGITEKVQTRLSRAIGRKLTQSGALIVIDEAQHCDTRALDQIRSLHDLYGVGVCLVGNETVYARLEGQRQAALAQLYSRVGMRMTQAVPRQADMDALIDAWGVNGAEARLARAIAKKPGALRGMTKTFQLASMIAAGESAALAERHLKAAYAQLNPIDGGRS